MPSDPAIDKMVECGITWFRADFPYSDNNNWEMWDTLAVRAKSRGLEFFATIFASWIGEPPAGGWDKWEDFVYRIVSHFKGSVRYWGIGNEHNPGAWSLDQYVQLVRRAYAGAKRADSTCQIVAPAFSSGGPWQQDLADFLDRALNYVDVIDQHYYYSASDPTAESVLQAVDATKRILDAHGAANKPFWITETGLQSLSWGEELQASFYAEMCDGVAARPWIKKIFFYDLIDQPGEHPTLWGILRTDLSPKPSFFAYQAAIAAYKKPLVVSRPAPANASQQVPLNSVIAIEFSRGVNQASVLNALTITPSFGFTSEWSVHTLSIIPTARLSSTTTYTIKVKATTVSVIGDSLDGNGNGRYEGPGVDDFSFSFTTDTTGKPGVVLTSSPRQGAVGVVTAAIQLTFQLPMERASVESAFSISPAISGFFIWEKDKMASFYLFGTFKAGTFYTVRVGNKAKDRWGYPLDGNGNGGADSLDDFVLYFATTGKGTETFYPMTGEFPLNFIGTSVGTAKTAKATLPDTVQIKNIQSGKLRLVTKGVDDTSEVHFYINGTGPLMLAAQAVGGDNATLSEVSFPGSILKTGENEMRFVYARDLGGTRSGFQIVPMALVVSYVTEVSEGRGLPEGFALFQNYPNPFNSSTTINYEVRDETQVTLKVYNILGQKIETLVD
ncbi:MAG: Ig-like domain-containing protein, partial [Ignavibacteriales bacterium]|nr:Ig-like domain-containing protein [Ignavibacteriales bacterium]